MRQKILPENYPNIANSLNNKGISYGNIGNHQKEFQYYMKSLEIRQKIYSENHPDCVIRLNKKCLSYLSDHQKSQACILI